MWECHSVKSSISLHLAKFICMYRSRSQEGVLSSGQEAFTIHTRLYDTKVPPPYL